MFPEKIPEERHHWLSFKDACVFLREVPSRGQSKGTLLFVHGRIGHSQLWNTLIQQLSNHFRCLALDLPGFGESYTILGPSFTLQENSELLTQIIENFAPEGVIVVGHDFGGAAAQLNMLARPELVQGIVLVNSVCLMRGAESLPRGFFGIGAKRKFKKLFNSASSLNEEHRIFLQSAWLTQGSRNELKNTIEWIQDTWPGHHEREFWKTRISQAKRPVLVLWGSKDPLNPLELAFDLVRVLPEVYFFQHERASRWPCLEEPNWVIAKMREFLFRAIPIKRKPYHLKAA